MVRWHHGHSILTGLLIGFLLSRELVWAASLAFLAGLLLGRGWSALARIGRWLRHSEPPRLHVLRPHDRAPF